MIFEDRWYQTECVQAIWNYFRTKTGNPICALPTGTGKAVIIARFLQSVYAHYSNQKILVMTHSKELVEQNYLKMLAMWPTCPAGLNSAALGRRDYAHKVIFCGIGSIARSYDKFGKVDLVLIDECHLVSPDEKTQYRKVIDGLLKTNPYLKVVGFSATAYRQGLGDLTEGGLFTDTCYDLTGPEAFNRLIAEGYLAPLITKKPDTVFDTDGIHIRGGEFKLDELSLLVNQDDKTAAIAKECILKAFDRKHWLFFCSGVDHCIRTAEILNAFGVSTVAIHSEMGDKARDQAILDFKSGKYRAATNNNILTTGFDFPGLDFIAILRPTMSVSLWVQMLGRGTRPWWEKINTLVLDFANNIKRLGPINDPYTPKKKGKGSGEAPVKDCPVCGQWLPASVRFCGGKSKADPEFNKDKGCGHEFIFADKLVTTAGTGDIIKGELPQVEEFKVDQVVYNLHLKRGGDAPPAMRVSYYCGMRRFEEYICIEHHHVPYAAKLARDWWRVRLARMGIPDQLPVTTEQGFQLLDFIGVATHIRVWLNKKHPQIMAHCLDGSGFGKLGPMDTVAPPEVTIAHATKKQEAMSESVIVDDDIPF